MDDQAQQPTDAQPAADGAAASDQPRESESGVMNALIRRVSGFFGRDDEASAQTEERPAAEQPAPADTPVDQQPGQIVLTQEQFDRAVQSRSDQLLARQQRDWAKSRADEGDLLPIRQLAEKGDPWAKQQLAEREDTWALGEIAQKELREQQARENDPLPHIAAGFDQSVLHPLLGALPKEDEERIVGSGIVGLDGRKTAVEQSIAALKRHAADEALARAVTDESFAKKILAEGSALRRALLTNPTMNKQLRSIFRGDLDEPDLNPGSGPGRAGGRESDVMNDAIRQSYFGSLDRADDERAAMAPAGQNGRAANRDLLDDDE